MIVLLSSFMSLLANDNLHSSTGEVVNLNDSVLIAYDDLRLANSKLIEAEIKDKQIKLYKQIISNDSLVIDNYKKLTTNLNKDCKKYNHQRNVYASIALITILTSIVLIVK